jgi:hypothetical protein
MPAHMARNLHEKPGWRLLHGRRISRQRRPPFIRGRDACADLACEPVHMPLILAELMLRKPASIVGAKLLRTQMAAITRMLSRASGTQVDIETLKTIVMFCGVGLTVSLLLATYGLDLSPGFF